MAAGSLARMAEMSAPTRASPLSASVQARRSSSLGKKESFERASRQLRTSPKQDARSSVPNICFRTEAPSNGDVSSPSASSLNLAKILASRAASSSVYDDTGGCGAPGSGRSFCCSTCGAALAEYQLLGALLRRVQRAAPRAALRRALAEVSMSAAVNGAIVSSARHAASSFASARVYASFRSCSSHCTCSLAPGAPSLRVQRATTDLELFELYFSGMMAVCRLRQALKTGSRVARCAIYTPARNSTPPTRETSQRHPRSCYPVFVR